MTALSDAPLEVQVSIQEFWPSEEWDNAAAIAFLESGFDPFAVRDTTDSRHPCGARLGATPDGLAISAERSVGVFQINSCNFPTWEWQRFYNTRHNCGTAHLIWAWQGWQAWYLSAKKLGLA